MDTYLRISAEYAARFALRLFHAEHPDRYSDATPIDALVYWLGLQVETFHPDDYHTGTFGFIDPDEDEELIWLRRDLIEPLRRFTLAHELGHALLHCQEGNRLRALLERYATQVEQAELVILQQNIPEPSRSDPCQENDLQIESTLEQGPAQDLLSYDPRSQRELAANIFAAELLMPLERVRAHYLQGCTSTHELATIFDVSSAAMLNRLAKLFKPATLTTTQEPAQTATTKKQYDAFQQAAIETPTPALIVAGPGSGKTSTLVGRVDYIVHTLNVPPEQILALTFSRKAAQEMEERLRGLLNDVATNIPPKVSTFHAFCADLLRQHGTLIGLRTDFALIDEVEGYFILLQQAKRMRLRHYQSLSTPGMYFPDILKAISRAKDELITSAQYMELARTMYAQAVDAETIEKAEKTLEVAHVYALYEEELQRRGDTDFGGLIMQAVQLLRDQQEVRSTQQGQYQHILVDEFQDMNRASGVLLRELAGEHCGVWVVGDANQAIYRFRGASPANISQFASDFPGAVILPLSRNYRSRPDLVTLAETFRSIRLEPGQQPGKNRPVRQPLPGTCVIVAQASDEAYELAGLLQDIRHKHTHGYAYRDIVVLCRKRSQVQRITAALAAEGLPVNEHSSIFEQEHSQNLIAIVLLLANVSGMGLLRAARLPDHYMTQADIEILLRTAREQKVTPRSILFGDMIPFSISVEGRQALERLASCLLALQRSTDMWSLLMQYLLEESSQVRNLLSSETGSAILADYDALLQLARRYDQHQRHQQQQREQEARERDEPAPEPPTLEERCRGWLEYLNLLRFLRQDGSNRQSTDKEGETDSDSIRVMTVHASKGLEFPVVYLPDLVQRSFPLDRRGSRVPIPTGMLPAESDGEIAHQSGESCLFYVGVTRAREHLILSYSERKNGYTRSPYLEALLGDLPPANILQQQWNATTVNLLQSPADEIKQGQPSSDFISAMKPTQLSMSHIESYLHCPRQYAYNNIYHFSEDARDYRLFHQATQKTLEELQLIIHKGIDLPDQQELQELYTQHWQALGGPASAFSTMYEEHGHEVVETMRRQLIIEQRTQRAIRQKFDTEIAGRIIQVTIDRVEQATLHEPVRFVRARFGQSKKPFEPDLRDLLYTLTYRQQFAGQEAEIYTHNMSRNELVPRKLSSRVEKNRQEKIVQLIEGLERDEYPAHPAKADTCASCPFYWICPA